MMYECDVPQDKGVDTHRKYFLAPAGSAGRPVAGTTVVGSVVSQKSCHDFLCEAYLQSLCSLGLFSLWIFRLEITDLTLQTSLGH